MSQVRKENEEVCLDICLGFVTMATFSQPPPALSAGILTVDCPRRSASNFLAVTLSEMQSKSSVPEVTVFSVRAAASSAHEACPG